MATERSLNTAQATLAAEGRIQANVLLHALLNDRRLVEERSAAAGRDDPLKRLTGRSAMDRAIVSTREIITRMDDLLAELREAAPASNGTIVKMAAAGSNGISHHAASQNGSSHALTAQLDARS